MYVSLIKEKLANWMINIAITLINKATTTTTKNLPKGFYNNETVAKIRSGNRNVDNSTTNSLR